MSLNLPGNTAMVVCSQMQRLVALVMTIMNGMKTFCYIRESEKNRAGRALKSSSSLPYALRQNQL